MTYLFTRRWHLDRWHLDRWHLDAWSSRLSIAVFVAFFSLKAVAAESTKPPNFIVILCDNLGYGDIEPFGSTVHRTPSLNRMAAEGRTFDHFYVSSGVCTPSRASLITGCYSQRVGMHTNPRDGWVLRPLSPYGLHPDEVTIADTLKSAGYLTAIIGKWHLGDQPPFLPTAQGFDRFFGVPYSDDMTQAVGKRIAPRFNGNHWPPLPLMRQDKVVEAPVDRNGLTARYTAEAINVIQENRDRPFFLFLSHAMPGSTKQPFASERFRGKSANGPWGDAVEELDWSTGQILDALDNLNLSENTLVIWTSDNGAPSNKNDLSRGTNAPLHGRGYTTSEGAFRVPTIARWVNHVPAQTTCSDLLTTMDLLPTFAALASAPATAGQKIDGRDASKQILGETTDEPLHEAFFYYRMDQLQAVRSGPYKLFLPLSEFDAHPHFKTGQGDRPLLFDVVDDVGCTTDIASVHPEVVARLTELAIAQRKKLGDRNLNGDEARPPGYIEHPTARVLSKLQ